MNHISNAVEGFINAVHSKMEAIMTTYRKSQNANLHNEETFAESHERSSSARKEVESTPALEPRTQGRSGLLGLFIEELGDIYHSEGQIAQSLGKLIKLASSIDLKDALSKHLNETEKQIERLENIFSLLRLPSAERQYATIGGLLRDAEALIQNRIKSPLLDATLISSLQKIEHYEIAVYGTLLSFAKHLDLDRKIIDLLHKNLDEEVNADKKLTRIAEGTFFTSGINDEAAAIAG